MNPKLVVGVISAIVMGTFLYSGSKRDVSNVEGVQTEVQTTANTEEESQASQTKTMGAVDVELTPIKLEPGQSMVFELALNTHSVDLSYNYAEIISAEDNNGNRYDAIKWSGGEGGHHLRGEVELEPLLKDVNKIKIYIGEIDNAKAEFEWEI